MGYIDLQYPQHNESVCSFFPAFGFHHSIASYLNIGLQVSDDPTFATYTAFSDSILNPTEWEGQNLDSGVTINFVFPSIKPISPDGVYYWRVSIWDTTYGTRESEIRKINIVDAAYRFRLQNGLNILELVPERVGVSTEKILVGCELVEKHVFKIKLAAMNQTMYNALKVFYDLNTSFYYLDNQNTSYAVYWGECDRSIKGNAFQSIDREFGIKMLNFKSGALRWSGEITLTEI